MLLLLLLLCINFSNLVFCWTRLFFMLIQRVENPVFMAFSQQLYWYLLFYSWWVQASHKATKRYIILISRYPGFWIAVVAAVSRNCGQMRGVMQPQLWLRYHRCSVDRSLKPWIKPNCWWSWLWLYRVHVVVQYLKTLLLVLYCRNWQAWKLT